METPPVQWNHIESVLTHWQLPRLLLVGDTILMPSTERSRALEVAEMCCRRTERDPWREVERCMHEVVPCKRG